MFYAIFPFFCFLIGTKKRAWITFGLSIIFNLICTYYFDAIRTNIIYSSMYFIAGGLLYLYKDDITGLFKKMKLYIIVILLVSLIGYYLIDMKSILILLISISLIIMCIFDREGGQYYHSFISNNSMEIYLCRMMIYRGVEKLQLIHISTNDLFSYVFVSCLVFIGAIFYFYK